MAGPTHQSNSHHIGSHGEVLGFPAVRLCVENWQIEPTQQVAQEVSGTLASTHDRTIDECSDLSLHIAEIDANGWKGPYAGDNNRNAAEVHSGNGKET